MVKSDRVGTFLYRSIVEAHPDIVGIPVMPSIEQRIGVIWKKGKYQNATTEKVIKFYIKLLIKKESNYRLYTAIMADSVFALFLFTRPNL